MGYGRPGSLGIQPIAAIVRVFSNGSCKHVAAPWCGKHCTSRFHDCSSEHLVPKAGNNRNVPMATMRLISLYSELQPTVVVLTDLFINTGKIQYVFTKRQAAS